VEAALPRRANVDGKTLDSPANVMLCYARLSARREAPDTFVIGKK
jgi:hypothetical protein